MAEGPTSVQQEAHDFYIMAMNRAPRIPTTCTLAAQGERLLPKGRRTVIRDEWILGRKPIDEKGEK